MVQAYWQKAGWLPPTVISLSYGPVWLLAPKGQAEHSGLLNSIWPAISAIEVRVGKPRRRLLMGESMGGLNSLVLGLSHPQHFDKVHSLGMFAYALLGVECAVEALRAGWRRHARIDEDD